MYKKPSKYETVSLFLVDPNFEASCTKKNPAKYEPVS